MFFLSRCFFLLLSCSFFFALQLFALRFSSPRFVVVSFVQCNKFHLTANEGTRHPPTATDGLPSSNPSLFLALSLLLLLLRLVAAAFSSCGLRFVVCYLFLFSMRSLLFALPIMRCTHSQTPTHTDTHNYSCIFVYSQLHLHASWPVCLFSNLCLSICSRLSLLPLSFHFVCLNARVVVFIVVTPLCSASLVSAN